MKGKKGDFKTMLKEAGALFGITLIAGLMLGFVYQLTKEPIAKQQALAVQKACAEVMSDADHFTEISYELSEGLTAELTESGVKIGTIYEAYSAGEEFMGYVIESTSSQGYGGDIVLYLGIDPYTAPMTLKGTSVLSISETAGLGMRAGEVLLPQLSNKQVDVFTYTKTGSAADSEIDAISGATITTKAVTNAVNGGMKAAKELFATAVSEGKVTSDEQ